MILVKDGQFTDESARILMLRGVNLGGSSKVPYHPDGATWNRDHFYDHRDVSFVGRPFPLAEADEHFERLQYWGLTFIRFLITWEAVEHSGPGIYDEEYLQYLHDVIAKANEYGMQVFIDPHQDVWSRFTGGDGAPGWTLETVGMDLSHLHAAGAAFLHQEAGDPYPSMFWPSNYNRFAAATMFTLFFAGKDFAPGFLVNGMNIQDYLQCHYIDSLKRVAIALCDLPNVVGFDTLNEPSSGFIGVADLSQAASISPVLLGDVPTPFQSMLLSSGYSQKVPWYTLKLSGFEKNGMHVSNAEGISIWQEGREDIWKQHGVWNAEPGSDPLLLKKDYFSSVSGKKVHFNEDYFKPFANRVASEIRSILPGAIIFLEEIPESIGLTWTENDAQNVVSAAHWYDDTTLMTKTFLNWFTADVYLKRPVFGRASVRQTFVRQIQAIIQHALKYMNHIPTLFGEVGIPMDLYDKKAYRTSDERNVIEAMDTTMYALETNLASFTLWNYTADNTNARGDQWNDEDLSIFSRDQMTHNGSIYDGGRAMQAVVRPYPMKTAGTPFKLSFDIRTKEFNYSFHHRDDRIHEPTEIFVPSIQYPQGFRVLISDGKFEIDREHQRVRYYPGMNISTHDIQILPA